jgi:hypothetical protein
MVFKPPTARRREGVDGGQPEGGLVKKSGKCAKLTAVNFRVFSNHINYLSDFF